MARERLCKWWRKVLLLLLQRRERRRKKAPKQAAQSKKQKPKVSDGKPKGKCFTCGQKRYWRGDCPKKSKTQNGNNSGMSFAYVVEICLMACTTVPGVWILEPLIMSVILCRGSKKPGS